MGLEAAYAAKLHIATREITAMIEYDFIHGTFAELTWRGKLRRFFRPNKWWEEEYERFQARERFLSTLGKGRKLKSLP